MRCPINSTDHRFTRQVGLLNDFRQLSSYSDSLDSPLSATMLDSRSDRGQSTHIDSRLTLDLRPGELVEVRGAREILATLDEKGELDSLPFMPEMLQFCGRQFRVSHRADKTCDTIGNYHARRMYRTVHLEQLRCDGSGHDNCQAGCLLFWKEAWLTRAKAGAPAAGLVQIQARSAPNGNAENGALSELLARVSHSTDQEGIRYFCQATELLRASEPLAWWDLRQYLRDISTRNVSPVKFFRGCWFAVYAIARRKLRAPRTFPFIGGKLTTTPSERLDLRPGELVQVKSREEIYATLNTGSRNRGLYYDIEMWRFSGGKYRVLRRVDQIVNEKNGRMIKLPNGCVILDGVHCSGERSTHRLFCQRSIFPYWREIWLRRVT
jgi:hypothetical protein